MTNAIVEENPVNEVVLITGFPAFTTKKMVEKTLRANSDSILYLLARDRFQQEAKTFLEGLGEAANQRAHVVVGDICAMDLGLSGEEYENLCACITTIQHMAGIYYVGTDKGTARRVNVEGTRCVLHFATDCKSLRRFCHWSTVMVSGKRRGVIMEDELIHKQGFRNFYEETKFESEKLIHTAGRRIPVTVFRPSIIVGDSRTGEIDKFDGPYYLMVLIATNSTQVHLPLPGRGSSPLHLVPIDFVIDAAYQLTMDQRGAGKTFHLCDPSPYSARRAYEEIAHHAQTRTPKGRIPGKLARTILRAPGLKKLSRGPLFFLESFDEQVFYNCQETTKLLETTKIRCPSFDVYAPALVRYVKEVHAAKRQEIEDDIFDPFD